MKHSAERIQYITDFLSSYKCSIESLNKNGLFDSATLYELFALEVCKLWFGQSFRSLNTQRSNFPSVDLVSEDGYLYIQVSTGQNIPDKVKATLEKIGKSDDPDLSKIETIYFFVLGNDSIEKIPDYTGKDRIGKIDFSPDNHLISINKIIIKAKTDYIFQKSLYDLLKQESDSFQSISRKFDEEVSFSREIVQTSIDGLINGEYEINRQELISQIRSENVRYISIVGDAGMGKSSLCKKLLLEEELFLFARAEKIDEVTNINSIWDLDINSLLRYLSPKRIVFCIDALEYLADGRKTNIDLLQHLYEITQKYNNAYIFTSCRTSDKNAFLRLMSTYEIKEYLVPEIDDKQLVQVAKRYPIIAELSQLKQYSQLLRSPFYLDVIVKKIQSVNDLENATGLRSFIWEKVICLQGKPKPPEVSTDDIREAVNRIVFTRAKEFSIGVPKESIQYDALSLLLSSGIIILANSKVRLKFDIFEDICFEQLFDREFDSCKGDYPTFFKNISDLGRCVFRRYQIWVENKLFAKEGRDRFLYALVFSESIPEKWKKETIIGITKSRICADFFKEYGTILIDTGLIKQFFDITNLYSFDPHLYTINNNKYTIARPIGKGRECLIQIANKAKLYEHIEYKDKVIKMCTDYARSSTFEESTANEVCSILEQFVIIEWKNASTVRRYSKDLLIRYLDSLYYLAAYCAEWIKGFWDEVLKSYRSNSRIGSHSMAAAGIIDHTIRNTTLILARTLPKDLSALAWAYWVESSEKDYIPSHYAAIYRSPEYYYGLNENASDYSYKFRSINENTFLYQMSLVQFESALHWGIQLSNHVTNNLQHNRPEEIFQIELIEYPHKTKYTYLAHPDFFFAGVLDNSVPMLLGDTVHIIRRAIFQKIDWYLSNKDATFCVGFVNWLKKTILAEANNIIFLGILEDIGLIYSSHFPGYSILFASSIDYVMIDSKRELLHRGTPGLMRTRYDVKNSEILSLTEYIVKNQLFGCSEVIEQCRNTLDYLYSITPNNEEHALQHLQIQKMDARRAEIIAKGDLRYYVSQVSGAAQDVIDNYGKSKTLEELSLINRLESQYSNADDGASLSIADCISGIDKLGSMIESCDNAILFEATYFKYLACILSRKDLDVNTRSQYCLIWINRLNRDNNSSMYAIFIEQIHVLFEQADNSLSKEANIALKNLFLEILLNKGKYSNNYRFKETLKKYLPQNERWAKLLFNTILALAKDEMECNQYNATFLVQHANAKAAWYTPNLSPKPSAKACIDKLGGNQYQSQFDLIVQKYLLDEEDLKIGSFDINQYDISVLCCLSNCGLSLSNRFFYTVIRAIVDQLTLIWINNIQTERRVSTLFEEAEVSSFLKNAILEPTETDLVLNLLFSEIDYSRFVSSTYSFYEEVLISYLPHFVDAYDKPEYRHTLKAIVKKIESRVLSIQDEYAQIQMYRALFLPQQKYYYGDWTACKTEYSYSDKQFLNCFWEKYGHYHLNELLTAIYELQINKLLPEVLPSVYGSFFKAQEECSSTVDSIIARHKQIINRIVTTAFVENNDQIKMSQQLIDAYESLLELFVEHNVEIAAVILDEFRIH